MNQNDLASIAPLLIVTLAGCTVLLAEAFRKPGDDMPLGGHGTLAAIGLIGAILASVVRLWGHDFVGFGVIIVDNYTVFFDVTHCAIGLLTVLLSSGSARRDDLPLGEYYALLLFSIVGMMLMGSTRDLLVIFLALEILSLAVYVMTGLKRASEQGAEAAFKYFVLGGFSSAFFLYGIALTYARTGTTKLDEIGMIVAGSMNEPNVLLILAMVLLLVGFAFKISAVPFHMWTPDAYEGAPTLVTGFMSTGVKAAAFAAFVRVFLWPFQPLHVQWAPVLSAIAGITMILGTVVGVASRASSACSRIRVSRMRDTCWSASSRPTKPGRRRFFFTLRHMPSRTSALLACSRHCPRPIVRTTTSVILRDSGMSGQGCLRC